MDKLDRVQYLLACLAEEAGELAQASGKALRFGIYDGYEQETKFSHIKREIHDVMTCYVMLCKELNENPAISAVLTSNKELRIEKYYDEAVIKTY